jgi:hypothetical protein
MALYIVVQHRRDPEQPWSNTWTDDDRLAAISTTEELAGRCGVAQERGEAIFVHRCAWAGWPAIVCCSVQVKDTRSTEGFGWVEFREPVVLTAPPPVQPARGQSHYEAPAPAATA